MCKKEYLNVFESTGEDWRKKHDYKNLKDLGYQVDKVEADEKTDEETEEEADEDTIPEWVEVSKGRFEVIKSMVNRYRTDGLHAKVNKKNIMLNSATKFLQDIATGVLDDKEEAKKIPRNCL